MHDAVGVQIVYSQNAFGNVKPGQVLVQRSELSEQGIQIAPGHVVHHCNNASCQDHVRGAPCDICTEQSPMGLEIFEGVANDRVTPKEGEWKCLHQTEKEAPSALE